jgi:hypothetical protein
MTLFKKKLSPKDMAEFLAVDVLDVTEKSMKRIKNNTSVDDLTRDEEDVAKGELATLFYFGVALMLWKIKNENKRELVSNIFTSAFVGQESELTYLRERLMEYTPGWQKARSSEDGREFLHFARTVITNAFPPRHNYSLELMALILELFRAWLYALNVFFSNCKV